MKFLDNLFERSSRQVANVTSRRKLLGRFGSLLVAGAALPIILPIDRTSKALAAEAPKAATRVIRTAATTGATAPSTASSAPAAAVPPPPARPAPMLPR